MVLTRGRQLLITVFDIKFLMKFKLLILNIFLVLLILYATEAFLFFTNPQHHLPRHGYHDGVLYSRGHIIRENSNHFRDKEFNPTKQPDSFRVMILGDSLTYGEGVEENNRFTNQLEDMLHAQFPGIIIDILNFGVRGAPTTFERDLLQSWKNIIHPDLIIVGFCVNDPQPKSQDYNIESERISAAIYPIVWGLNSLNLNLLSSRVEAGLKNLAILCHLMPDWPEALQRTYELNSEEWNNFRRALEDIREASDSMELPKPIFAVLTQGVYADRPTNYKQPDRKTQYFIDWYFQAELEAKNLGFRTINFMEDIIDQFPSTILAVNAEDGHPPEELHHLYAEGLKKLVALDIEKWIDKPKLHHPKKKFTKH
jgi:lysophospholipase L1-like esterase